MLTLFSPPASAQGPSATWRQEPWALESLSPARLEQLFEGRSAPSRFAWLPRPLRLLLPIRHPVAPFHGVELPAVAFTDRAPVAPLLIKAIDRTRSELRLALYDLNQAELLAAIQRARSRQPRVQVHALLDSSHVFPANGRPRSTEIQALLDDPGIELRVIRGLDDYGTMHNKFAIFDGQLVKYGSYNWTKTAEARNHENALFTADPHRVRLYAAYWAWMWKNARAPTGPAPPHAPTPGPPADPAPSVPFKGVSFPSVVFSPQGGAAGWIRQATALSAGTIDVAMFSFFEAGIADGLVAARSRGVKVRLVLDRTQAASSPAVRTLRQNGVPMRIMGGRDGSGVMHHKFGIFDQELVEAGSFNWTNNAEHNNFENVNFHADRALTAEFQSAFDRLWGAGSSIKTLPELTLPPWDAP